MKSFNQLDDEKLMYISSAEEYALFHNLKMSDTLKLFKKYSISNVIHEHYDVLHMLDISDTVSMVESVLGRSNS